MKRFLLLFLAFVLPLQMSWAAVHMCDDGIVVSTSAALVEAEGDRHDVETLKKSESEQPGKLVDTCCGAAHSCHGLHHLMAQANPHFGSAAATQIPIASRATPHPGYVLSRVDRPKWLAA